jgi:hypothetical protein
VKITQKKILYLSNDDFKSKAEAVSRPRQRPIHPHPPRTPLRIRHSPQIRTHRLQNMGHPQQQWFQRHGHLSCALRILRRGRLVGPPAGSWTGFRYEKLLHLLWECVGIAVWELFVFVFESREWTAVWA